MPARADRKAFAKVDWQYDFRRLLSDNSTVPVRLPGSTFYALNGIDGRSNGTLKRFLGFEPFLGPVQGMHASLWVSPNSDQDFYVNNIVSVQAIQDPSEPPRVWLLVQGAGELQVAVFNDNDLSTPIATTTISFNGAGYIHSATGDRLLPDVSFTGLVSVTTFGRYVYVAMELDPAPSALVLWLDENDNTIKVDFYGIPPGVNEPELFDFNIGPEFSPGKSIVGNLQFRWRLWDTKRSRGTRLSKPFDFSFQNKKKHRRIWCQIPMDGSTQALRDFLSNNFDQVEMRITLNTFDLDVPAGGLFFNLDNMNSVPYLVGEPGQNAWGFWTGVIFFDGDRKEVNPDDPFFDFGQIPFSDATIASHEAYDSIQDEPELVPKLRYLAEFKGLTFALEVRKDHQYYVLRWTNTARPEKETFPRFNEFITTLPTNRPAQFVVAGDALILLGDGEFYRIRNLGGGLISVQPIGSNLHLVSNQAALAIGGVIYAVTTLGVVEISAGTGATRYIASLNRVITKRWAGALGLVSMSYDSRLDAIFILNPGLGEAVVLWRQTGVISFLSALPFTATTTVKSRGISYAAFAVTQTDESSSNMKSLTMYTPVQQAASEYATYTTFGARKSELSQFPLVGPVLFSAPDQIWIDVPYDDYYKKLNGHRVYAVGNLNKNAIIDRVEQNFLGKLTLHFSSVSDDLFITGDQVAMGAYPTEAIMSPLNNPEGDLIQTTRHRVTSSTLIIYEDPEQSGLDDWLSYLRQLNDLTFAQSGIMSYEDAVALPSYKAPGVPTPVTESGFYPAFAQTRDSSVVSSLGMPESSLNALEPWDLTVESRAAGYILVPFIRFDLPGLPAEAHEVHWFGDVTLGKRNYSAFSGGNYSAS